MVKDRCLDSDDNLKITGLCKNSFQYGHFIFSDKVDTKDFFKANTKAAALMDICGVKSTPSSSSSSSSSSSKMAAKSPPPAAKKRKTNDGTAAKDDDGKGGLAQILAEDKGRMLPKNF